MEIDDRVMVQFMDVCKDWKRYGSNRVRNHRTWDEWHFDGTLNVPRKYVFLEPIMHAMIHKVSEIHGIHEPILLGSMVLCYYKDGSWATGTHRHGHRTLTVSIGFPREFTVNSKKILMKNGDFIDINKHAHGVPKMDVQDTGPRFSMNLFYFLESDLLTI